MSPVSLDLAVRLAAFRFLAEKTRVFGDALPWGLLQRGFEFDCRRFRTVGCSESSVYDPWSQTLTVSHGAEILRPTGLYTGRKAVATLATRSIEA